MYEANSPTRDAVRLAVANGDLEELDREARAEYYKAVCESVGLNPLTRPLDHLELNGKLTLYAKRDATDQLRHKHQVSIEIVDRVTQEDVYIVRARATLPDGRSDGSLGAVSLAGLNGEALANALMKAETKAKRRVALSICGLGLLDETEVETIRDVRTGDPTGGVAGPRLSPAAVFRAWNTQGHTSRRVLYEYVNETFGKRVTTLHAEEIDHVLQWIATQAQVAAPTELDGDVA